MVPTFFQYKFEYQKIQIGIEIVFKTEVNISENLMQFMSLVVTCLIHLKLTAPFHPLTEKIMSVMFEW